MAYDTLLNYTNFNVEFRIYTNASDFQLEVLISRKIKPITFYSRKLIDDQNIYTVTEREILNMVETLKEFRTILRGQILRIYYDHKNFTCKNLILIGYGYGDT